MNSLCGQNSRIPHGEQGNNVRAIEFFSPQESIERLRELEQKLEAKLIEEGSFQTAFAVRFMLLALRLERLLIEEVNTETQCFVPWSVQTGFPSHGTLIADAVKYDERHSFSPLRSAVVHSLNEWSEFAQENVLCCCGGNLLKPKRVSLSLKLNTVLKENQDGLSVECFVGVETASGNHRKHHYTFTRPSSCKKDIAIVSVFEHLFREQSGVLNVISSRYLCAEEFSFTLFANMMESISP